MGIISRFLVMFGASFLGIGVIIFSYLRRRISQRARRQKRLRKIQKQRKQFLNNNPFKL